MISNLWSNSFERRRQALPLNGGEKNYLEFLFPRPRRLISSIYAANAVMLGKYLLSVSVGLH